MKTRHLKLTLPSFSPKRTKMGNGGGGEKEGFL